MARHLGGTFRVEGINSRSHFTLVLGFEEVNKNTERTGLPISRDSCNVRGGSRILVIDGAITPANGLING